MLSARVAGCNAPSFEQVKKIEEYLIGLHDRCDKSLIDGESVNTGSINSGNLIARYQDFNKKTLPTLPAGRSPGPALERFRDLSPILVLAIFEGDVVVLEPGSIGPLPMTHPVIVALIDCVNRRMLTPYLVRLLTVDIFKNASLFDVGELGEDLEEDEDISDVDMESDAEEMVQSRLYDGGLVVGVLDYRRHCSFATVNSNAGSPHTVNTPNTQQQHHGILHAMASQGIAPEMHKVFLRPSWCAMVGPILNSVESEDALERKLQFEESLLLNLNRTVITDPNPTNSLILEHALYDRDKFAVHAPKLLEFAEESTNVIHRPKNGVVKKRSHKLQSTSLPLNKLKRIAALEDIRQRKQAGACEAFLGIDQRRNLARSIRPGAVTNPIPTTIMNNPLQRVWRTVRFEVGVLGAGAGVLGGNGTMSTSSAHTINNQKQFYSCNVLLNNNNDAMGGFEVILRRGEVVDTAQGRFGFTLRFRLPTMQSVETYLASLKHLFGLEDTRRKLTVDVANPSVINSAAYHHR